MILGPHAAGYDPVIGREWARKLEPRGAPEPMPETTEELIGRIPGAERTWSIGLASAFRRDFGEAKDGRLWGQFERIAEALRRGRLDPGIVRKAYRDAMGPKAQNRGALFWFTLQREAGISGDALAALASGP